MISEASSSKSRRTNATIAESAAKELESLAVHMPNVSNSDARALAVRMYYIEVSNGMSPTDAQTNVSQMFLVCSRTVQRWVELWESILEKRPCWMVTRSTLLNCSPIQFLFYFISHALLLKNCTEHKYTMHS